MTASHPDDAFDRWRNALLDALSTPGNVMAWQDRQYQFAYQVGQFLVDSGGPGIPPVSDHAVYGVYVSGGGLLYVGQTRDARRRLRDLPVGESHHLATTVPPETWERVLVIQWPALITRIPAQEARRAEQLGPDSCGLGIEYLLQITYRPVMTARRRSTAGGWSARHIETSRSRGAAARAACGSIRRTRSLGRNARLTCLTPVRRSAPTTRPRSTRGLPSTSAA